MMSEQEQEELLVLVAELTDRYTSRESTSIPYEKARMLMEAVLYCIEEAKKVNATSGAVETIEKKDLRMQYSIGYELVIKKVKEANRFYNQFIPHFLSYGNICYYDTIVKGLPAFFLYYDARFCPQDHLLTLDYPVLQSLEEYCGIDRIEKYLLCVAFEQRFLHPIGEMVINELMGQYEYEFREAIINVCSPILRYKVSLQLLGKRQDKLILGENGLQQLKELVLYKTSGQVLTLCNEALHCLIENEYQGQEELYSYLSLDMQDFVVELKNATQYNCLNVLFPV